MADQLVLTWKASFCNFFGRFALRSPEIMRIMNNFINVYNCVTFPFIFLPFCLACKYSHLSFTHASTCTCKTRRETSAIRGQKFQRWRKSVLNPDRSSDWLSEEYCIISSIIIQCCEVRDSQPIWLLIVRIYLVFAWIFFDSVFNLCPMFNVSLLKESHFQVAKYAWSEIYHKSLIGVAFAY